MRQSLHYCKQAYLTLGLEVIAQENGTSDLCAFCVQRRAISILEPAASDALQCANLCIKQAYLTLGLEVIAQENGTSDLCAFCA